MVFLQVNAHIDVFPDLSLICLRVLPLNLLNDANLPLKVCVESALSLDELVLTLPHSNQAQRGGNAFHSQNFESLSTFDGLEERVDPGFVLVCALR